MSATKGIGEISPAAFTVLWLIRDHMERAERVSTGLLARETHMTAEDVRKCLSELSDWPEGHLIAA